LTLWEVSRFVDSGLSTDRFNTAFGGRVTDYSAQAVKHYWDAAACPMAWWLGSSSLTDQHQHVLESYGFTLDLRMTGMSCQLGDRVCQDIDLSSGFSVKRCNSVVDYHDFGAVLSSIFDPEDQAVKRFYHDVAQSSQDVCSQMVYYVGYHEGIAVSSGALFFTDVAGIYDVATRPEFRRRGFGSAIYRYLLDEAQRAGYANAVLVATAEGTGIYERVGFQKQCLVEKWCHIP
jgi:ribosomal protein S18 acetylase RimI-like enzyme